MKMVERVFEKRLRNMVELREELYGFVVGKGTIDAIFNLSQLQDKYLENDKECYVNAVMKMYQEVLSHVKVKGEDS